MNKEFDGQVLPSKEIDTPIAENEPVNFGPFQFFTLVLSIYVLVALFVESVFKLPPDVSEILEFADNVICLVFLTDFFIRLKQATNKNSL